MLYSTTLSLIQKVFCKWFSFSSKSNPIDILLWFRVMQSMKGMGAFSFADAVLRNSVLGTFRCYDQDKDEEESEYKIFSWDNIERAQTCVILAGKT